MRLAEYDECFIEPRGRVYIGVHGVILECKTRHEIYLYPRRLFIRTRNISLTLPRSRSGSVVNNMNDVDGQTGDKPK